jgi:hypothetical protein
MPNIRLSLSLVLILGLAAGSVHAAPPPTASAQEASMSMLLNALRSNRKAMIAVNLELTDEEAGAFWPIYDRYQKEVNALGDRLAGVVEEYVQRFRELPNDKAFKLIEEYLTIESDRAKVRRTYLNEFAKVLPGRKVARFYQIENKIDAVIRYDLAAAIPVVEEKRAPAGE